MEGTIRRTETTATPDQVFAVAADIAAYPEWASGVNDVAVLESDEDGHPIRAVFEVEGFIKRIRYELEYTVDPPNRMEWHAVPGPDIKDMAGYYEFNALEDGRTEIVYALRVEPAFSVPGFLRKQAEKQIVGAALRELKRRSESMDG